MGKKQYVKPALICQELHPETLLCACIYRNPNFNEMQQCGYTTPDMGFKIFGQYWVDCEMQDPTNQYCYQVSTGMIFGS